MSLSSLGSASDAAFTVTTQTGRISGLTLKEDTSGGSTFHIINDGATDMFKIKDSSNDLLTMATSSGDTTLKGGLNVKEGKLVVDSTTGYVGVWATPTVQLHVNGSAKVENGDFSVGGNKFIVKYDTGRIGINDPDPTEALHVKGNVKIEPDAAGSGGHLYATTGAIHFKYSSSAQGSVDREYYMASSAGVSLPVNQDASCSSNCVPTTSRIYMIRNKSGTNQITVTGSAEVKIYKNGVQGGTNSGASMFLEANGMAMCAYNVDSTRYDCWTWNE